MEKVFFSAVQDACEGLMVKSLHGKESAYVPDKRSREWLKVRPATSSRVCPEHTRPLSRPPRAPLCAVLSVRVRRAPGQKGLHRGTRRLLRSGRGRRVAGAPLALSPEPFTRP
jgi:hypothetical protein